MSPTPSHTHALLTPVLSGQQKRLFRVDEDWFYVLIRTSLCDLGPPCVCGDHVATIRAPRLAGARVLCERKWVNVMKKTSMLVAMAGLALAAASASAQVYSSSPSLDVLSNATISNTINVAAGPASVQDLNVIVQLTHTWDSDLDMVLQGPSGFVTLSTDNGGSGDNYLTTRFDDASATAINAGAAPFNSDFRPEATFNGWSGTAGVFTGNEYAALSGFNGASADGDWTLWVADGVGGDSGTLAYWSLEFDFAADPNNPNPPPPPPTSPSGLGSYVANAVQVGGEARFRVIATPAINPSSTGLSVSVDGSALGLGTFSLLDDGINDDGIAANNVFGSNQIINAPGGDYVVNFTVSDAQNRSSSGSFPSLAVIGCPPYEQPQSFGNLTSSGPVGDGGNSIKDFAFSGNAMVTELHVAGVLTSGGTGSFPSEARLRVNYTDGSFDNLQVFTQGGAFTQVTASDVTLPLPAPRRAADILSFETFESFNDAGLDATWDTICIAYKAAQTSPVILAGSATPNNTFPDQEVQFLATVAGGANPASTGLAVTIDLSALGGSGNALMLDNGSIDDGIEGNGIYGFRHTIPSDNAGGVLATTMNASDAEGRAAASRVVNVTEIGRAHV